MLYLYYAHEIWVLFVLYYFTQFGILRGNTQTRVIDLESDPSRANLNGPPEPIIPLELSPEALVPPAPPLRAVEAPLGSTRVLRPRKKPKDMRDYNILKRVHEEIVRERARQRPLANDREMGSALVADISRMLDGNSGGHPTSFYEAVQSKNASSWIEAMNSEIDSLLENGT